MPETYINCPKCYAQTTVQELRAGTHNCNGRTVTLPVESTPRKLWMIFVPVADNGGVVFPTEHHRIWDEMVRALAGGLTINRPAKGIWQNPATGGVYREAVIPVHIVASEHAIREIIKATIVHYKQESVLAFMVSETVIIMNKSDVKF